jgi:hypothetical protein
LLGLVPVFTYNIVMVYPYGPLKIRFIWYLVAIKLKRSYN